MIRRVQVALPAGVRRGPPADRPLRLLAVSDEREKALEFESNRALLEPLDGVLGCGDLEPAYLSFVADAFRAPLLYVRGNHDRGVNWDAHQGQLPAALDARPERLAGLAVAGLSWPAGGPTNRAVHDEGAAWQQALDFYIHARRPRPQIVLSHVPPRGLGDVPEDYYHRGFAAYHWLCRRVRPRLWLHGHTSPAASTGLRVDWGTTTLINVTGAVLIELDRRAPVSIAAAGQKAIGESDAPAASEVGA